MYAPIKVWTVAFMATTILEAGVNTLNSLVHNYIWTLLYSNTKSLTI